MHNKNVIAPISKVTFNQSEGRVDTAANFDTHEDLISVVSPAPVPKHNYEPTIVKMAHGQGGFVRKNAYDSEKLSQFIDESEFEMIIEEATRISEAVYTTKRK